MISTSASAMQLENFVRSIPDFPKPGIMFRDITPLLANAAALRETVRRLADHASPLAVQAVAAAEARGFIFAAPLALELGIGFIPVRKPGKLPFDTHSFHYELEYGSDTLEVHVDGFHPGERVLLIDDLLATGGTMHACARLVERAGGVVAACGFVIELTGLRGARLLEPYKTFSLLKYD